jgi:hypothetical protein
MKLKWDFKELTDFAERLTDREELGKHLGKATQDIAKKLHQMLITNTPVDFGTLQAFWKTSENYSYLVEDTGSSYEVTLINRAIYATWVNDGHKQRPGRFIPGYWEGSHFRYDPNANSGMVLKKSWVQGRFFVEKSILQIENSVVIEKIINTQLQNWFRWCVNGK